MKRLWKRAMRLGVMTVVFAGAVCGSQCNPGGGDTGKWQFLKHGGRARDLNGPRNLPVKKGLDVVVTQIISKVGGSSGWHSHPGARLA